MRGVSVFSQQPAGAQVGRNALLSLPIPNSSRRLVLPSTETAGTVDGVTAGQQTNRDMGCRETKQVRGTDGKNA